MVLIKSKPKIIYNFLIIMFLIILTSCSIKIEESTKEEITTVPSSMNIIIDELEYTINLENNETVNTLLKLLPEEFEMKELNGNEKYLHLDTIIPIDSIAPEHINAGDVMLYGNNCLVIFYKSFDTVYRYTPVGHIDNLPDLDTDNITVIIRK